MTHFWRIYDIRIITLSYRLFVAAVLLPCAGLLRGQPGDRIKPTLQAIRQIFPPDSTLIPAALMRPSIPMLPDGTMYAISKDGAVWLAAGEGVTRIDPKALEPDRKQYYHGPRYLPAGNILALAADDAHGVWVRTAAGAVHIELKPMTLGQKAAIFEEQVRLRHDRYGLVASSILKEPGNLASNRLHPTDNDGLWTAMYAAAECFRYAATGSKEALANARKSTEAVLFLEEVTGVQGLPARSYIRKGDWRPQGGVWHWTNDGKYEWKADTSSDEIVGHYYLFGIAYDLLPDANLKRRIAATCTRMTDHILNHGLNLVDIHGLPTYWGQWTEEYFRSKRGKSDSPLNALEILSFLKTAHRITGNERYAREYKRLAIDQGYAALSAKYLALRQEINYSDEELAFLPFYLLFRYERNESLLAVYRDSLGQWWKNAASEKNPLWTFIYMTSIKSKARTPQEDADLESAVRTLQQIPLDLITWNVNNSHRKDIGIDRSLDRFKQAQAVTLLSPAERPMMKWNGNPFRIDSGGKGNSEDDGAFYLLPYWMSKYHKILLGE